MVSIAHDSRAHALPASTLRKPSSSWIKRAMSTETSARAAHFLAGGMKPAELPSKARASMVSVTRCALPAPAFAFCALVSTAFHRQRAVRVVVRPRHSPHVSARVVTTRGSPERGWVPPIATSGMLRMRGT